MEIKVLHAINEKEIARIVVDKLIEAENSISLLKAIEDAIYETEGLCTIVTKESAIQLKSIIINKLTAVITHINNECAS